MTNKNSLFLFLVFSLTFGFSTLQAQTTIKKVLFQGYWWDYEHDDYPNGWANYLTDLAPRLKSMGIDAVWIPPSVKNSFFGSPPQPGVGYAPFDNYDLGDKYQKTFTETRLGTKDELLRMIAVMHANGIEVIQDIVPNHLIGAGSSNGAGGEDPAAPAIEMFTNFRYVSYASPVTDESETDYLSRSGRFHKNYQNFHPNSAHNCTGGDICQKLFGPDICYLEGSSGLSSNAIHNPPQTDNDPNNGYMRAKTREWLVWYKKQMGFDGIRIDAVKHFDRPACTDFIANLQFGSLWANGGNEMFAVGEYVGGTGDVDTWYNDVEQRAGVFDFNLRAFANNNTEGLYSAVYNFDGSFDLTKLPGAQQTGSNRVLYIGDTDTYIHRTVPFVNNHDTFRPIKDANGNYTGWDAGGELSAHIEPNEPRLSMAYAVIMAVDGNPQIFFEDLFDIGYNSNRFDHDPDNVTVRDDIINLIKCHQKLDFKNGVYKVRESTGDHLVIERSGKAIIGINDQFNSGQNGIVTCDFPAGTELMDYSGANGTTVKTVFFDGGCNCSKVEISTPAVNPALNIAGRSGYSVWAPKPGGNASYTVAELYAHLDTYSPPLSPVTTQEWEMADDLGDSHCLSLGQGGALPANSTNQRVVGKIFVDNGTTVAYEVYPVLSNRDVTIAFHDLDGNELHTDNGIGNILGNFNATYTGWITVKIRHSQSYTSTQKAFVKMLYTAPADVDVLDPANAPETRVSIWTGNGGTSDMSDCSNWEEGIVPDGNSTVIIPPYSSPQPDVLPVDLLAFSFDVQLKNKNVYLHWRTANEQENKGFYIEKSLNSLTFEEIGFVEGKGNDNTGHHYQWIDKDFTESSYYRLRQIDFDGSFSYSPIQFVQKKKDELSFKIVPNPIGEHFEFVHGADFKENTIIQAELLTIDGKKLSQQTGNLITIEDKFNTILSSLQEGVYFINLAVDGRVFALKLVK